MVALEGNRDGRDEGDSRPGRSIDAIKVVFKGKEIAAKIVDMGKATAEVDRGDWAIIKTRALDLPALAVDTQFSCTTFADPIFRLGNDYSKGIVVSTGYVGQRTADGLVTCLTDGHPGGQAAAYSISAGACRHSDWTDAGRLSLFVHPAAQAGNASQGAGRGCCRAAHRSDDRPCAEIREAGKRKYGPTNSWSLGHGRGVAGRSLIQRPDNQMTQ